MKERGPRASTPCKREGCGQRFDTHVEGLCPDQAGEWSHESGTSMTRPSTSFFEEEILTMADMLEAVQSCDDMRPFTREHSRILGALLGKAQRMKAWIQDRKRGGA